MVIPKHEPLELEPRPAAEVHGLAVKPLIGVLPRIEQRAEGRGLAEFMQIDVADGIVHAGGIPVVLGCTSNPDALERYLGMCDGFLVPGGLDIDPSLYGQERIEGCGPSWPARDEFESHLIPAIVAADKPILGICRGHQAFNVMCGGTLWQDLATQPVETVGGDGNRLNHLVPDHHVLSHRVRVVEGTLLAGILAGAGLVDPDGTTLVNSVHHQSVRRLGEGLVPNVFATDGVVEGVEMPGKRFALSVQWHPESLWRDDPRWLALFRAFVAACRFARQ